MKYSQVCLDSFVCTIPEVTVTTAELERRLEPLYSRLKLPEGRLELMTGIAERRIWLPGKGIGEQSTSTAESLIRTTGIDPKLIGAVIHGSVCRDYLEPATVCDVHRHLKLSPDCSIFDVSNACLGIMTGIVQIANMIELGQIKAGIAVGTESSRSLMESTIAHLNSDLSITRKSIKGAFASLTIGSGSAAVLLTHKDISPTQNRLLGGVARCASEFSHLCRSETDRSGGDAMSPLMETDSEMLMHEGIKAAGLAFEQFLETTGLTRKNIDRTFCHQVGRIHQQLLFETLGLELPINFSSLEYLGNTGSAALPTAAAIGTECGFARSGDRIALMGIGSGINVMMLGLEWNKTIPGGQIGLEEELMARIVERNKVGKFKPRSHERREGEK